MKAISLTILLILVSSCASTPHTKIGIPQCDALIPVTMEVWNDLDLLREAISHNQLADEECITKLRSRIELHDASR